MTIADLKRGDRFTVADAPECPVLTFGHLDGMYSYSETDDGQIAHLGPLTPVEPEQHQ